MSIVVAQCQDFDSIYLPLGVKKREILMEQDLGFLKSRGVKLQIL